MNLRHSKAKAEMAQKTDLLQGTLDMLVLRVLARGELHGWGITQRLEQLSKRALQVDEGSLYPALYRMEAKGWIEAEWRITDNNRRAKFYALTRAGRKQLESEKEGWARMTGIIAQVMRSA
ncbi:MAG: PadR family transcriptional regulator [Opitutaceae bacterium]|jgi:transcriptional regulator